MGGQGEPSVPVQERRCHEQGSARPFLQILGDKEVNSFLVDRLLEEEKVVETLQQLESVEEGKEEERYRQLWKQMEDRIRK